MKEEEAEGAKREREVEAQVLEKVGELISGINKAKHVDQVICKLHSIANLLFPLDASLLSGRPSHLKASLFYHF